jgi:NAD(P) transhydrogenase subunit alpha
MPRLKSFPGRFAVLIGALLALLIAAGPVQAQAKTDKSSDTVASPSDAAQSDAHPDSTMTAPATGHAASEDEFDYMSMVFVFMLATFIGIGVIRRVSRLLHTPLMSLTNAISAISVVGSIIVAGGTHYPVAIRILGAVALFASMTNIISGFLITDRMLKMFKTREEVKA